MGVLTVKLIKASNLKDADFLGKTDPYVKMELEQDNVVSIIIFVDACRIELERKVMRRQSLGNVSATRCQLPAINRMVDERESTLSRYLFDDERFIVRRHIFSFFLTCSLLFFLNFYSSVTRTTESRSLLPKGAK